MLLIPQRTHFLIFGYPENPLLDFSLLNKPASIFAVLQWAHLLMFDSATHFHISISQQTHFMISGSVNNPHNDFSSSNEPTSIFLVPQESHFLILESTTNPISYIWFLKEPILCFSFRNKPTSIFFVSQRTHFVMRSVSQRTAHY